MNDIRERPKIQECYAKTLIWILIEILSTCCIFNPANIFSIILGSLVCYFNNCFAYYKYLETVNLSEENPKNIICKSFFFHVILFICVSKGKNKT